MKKIKMAKQKDNKAGYTAIRCVPRRICTRPGFLHPSFVILFPAPFIPFIPSHHFPLQSPTPGNVASRKDAFSRIRKKCVTDEQTDGRTDKRTDGRTIGRTDRRTDQRTNGTTDGPTDKRTDQRTDRPSHRDEWTHLKTCMAHGRGPAHSFRLPKHTKERRKKVEPCLRHVKTESKDIDVGALTSSQ